MRQLALVLLALVALAALMFAVAPRCEPSDEHGPRIGGVMIIAGCK